MRDVKSSLCATITFREIMREWLWLRLVFECTEHVLNHRLYGSNVHDARRQAYSMLNKLFIGIVLDRASS